MAILFGRHDVADRHEILESLHVIIRVGPQDPGVDVLTSELRSRLGCGSEMLAPKLVIVECASRACCMLQM